jgi:putative tryptophan/tyrosine transport system substrate-binding protein
MKRRRFIQLLGGSATFAALGKAQADAPVRRVGILPGGPETDTTVRANVTAFRLSLAERGWIEGRTLHTEIRWNGSDRDRKPTPAAELLATQPEVIFVTSNPALQALQQEQNRLPTVFVNVADPVGEGFIDSLGHPGRNVTGFTNFEPSIGGKWMQLLKEIAPGIDRVAILLHPDTPANVAMASTALAAAAALGVAATQAPVRSATEIEQAVGRFAAAGPGGLVVIPHVVTAAPPGREIIIELAAKHRLPAIYPFRFYAELGGLTVYGIDAVDLFRQAAAYVDRILRGEKPAELPVQAPNKFALVINLRTARNLGLEISNSVLARADEVIE